MKGMTYAENRIVLSGLFYDETRHASLCASSVEAMRSSETEGVVGEAVAGCTVRKDRTKSYEQILATIRQVPQLFSRKQ